jgi:hypothetical protein
MTGFIGRLFTVTANYNSSYIELLLIDVCLRNLSLLSDLGLISSLSNFGSP